VLSPRLTPSSPGSAGLAGQPEPRERECSIPYNPQAVLSKLDVKLRTPTTPRTPDRSPSPWVSKTPQTTNEALSQSTLIKDRVIRHQGGSPTPILAAIEQLAKALVVNGHNLTLLASENKILREANEALSKRPRAERTRIQDGGSINGSQAREIMAEKGVVEEEGRVEGENEGVVKEASDGFAALWHLPQDGPQCKDMPGG
jgi:hypothetical protein